MNMNSSDNYCGPSNSELVNLSDHDLDKYDVDFGFILDDEEDDAMIEERGCLLDASSNSRGSIGHFLGNSIHSIEPAAMMDFQLEEALEGCDAIREVKARMENDNVVVDCCRSPQEVEPDSPPSLSPNPHNQEHQRQQHQHQKGYRMNTVDFDPPAQQPKLDRHHRRVSLSDVSTQSSSTVPTSNQSNRRVHASANDLRHQTTSESEAAAYGEALQKLAESMQRSEMTRQHVMMQRELLDPDQQRLLYLAKERLNRQQTQLRAQRQQRQSRYRSSPPSTAATATTSFFNGSAGGYSFASELQKSRKRLSFYMSQVNHRTM